MTHPALEIRHLNAWYNDAHVLRDINLVVDTGELVCILGENRSTPTPIMQTLSGRSGERTGSVCIHGTESIHLSANNIKPLGLDYCPDESDFIDNLSCEENLLLPVEEDAVLGGGMSLADIYEIFPALKPFQHQPIGHLQKPERQLLAVARALRLGANVLLLDQIIDHLIPRGGSAVAHALSLLKAQRYTIILASENPDTIANITHIGDQFHVIHDGVLKQMRPFTTSPL